jgi:hypothetical protein
MALLWARVGEKRAHCLIQMMAHEEKTTHHAPPLLSRPLEIGISIVSLLKDVCALAKAASKLNIRQYFGMQNTYFM